MNIRTAIVLAAFAVAGNAAELSIGNGTINTAKQPATLNVTLASAGASLSGFQFDLQYDAAALNVIVAAGPAASAAGKTVASNVLQGGRQRILIVGMNQTTIGDGIVAVLQVSLKSRAQAGKMYRIGMTGTVGTNAKAQAVSVSGGSGTVRVAIQRNGR